MLCLFRKASNALAMRDNGELKHGIDLSKRLQRAILEYATYVLIPRSSISTMLLLPDVV